MLETDCYGDVEILNRDWFSIINYHNYMGNDLPLTAVIGIVTFKDEYNNIITKIGVAPGLNEKQDTITIIDTGRNFYGYDCRCFK